MLARAACAIETVKQIAANCQATQAALNATATNLHLAQTSAGSSEEKVAELEVELASAETRLEQLESQLACEKAKSAPKRGRPAGHRGAEWLSEKWDDYTTDARRVAFWRHCGDIREALTAGGVDDWLPAALASVLDSFFIGDEGQTLVDHLFASRLFCLRKNQFVSSLLDIAQAEWGLDLSVHALSNGSAGLSRRQYQSLRNGFAKSMFKPANSADEANPRAGFYSKRPWYTCPVTNTVFNLPEPLLPLYLVDELMATKLSPLGLNLSVDGRISERGFLSTLRETFQRDRAVLKIFDVERKAHPCFGIDHATISGARDFPQGGITMGGCYNSGSLLSEQKHVTICIGLHKDDGSGLAAMLGPKEASESAGEQRPAIPGIAAEFQRLSDAESLDMGGGEYISCEPVVCLDFAAFRGLTRKRGKCSAVCACRGLVQLQSRPGANGIPDLPAGDTVEDLHAARAIAQSQCGYGTSKLELPSLQAATHRLPDGWDFERDGPWHCSWCDEDVWSAPGQQLAAEIKLAALRARSGLHLAPTPPPPPTMQPTPHSTQHTTHHTPHTAHLWS